MPAPGCGDGVLTPDEACDDGNRLSGDGCAADCSRTEPGFSCAAAGRNCSPIAVCGDGIVAVNEQCDDGNTGAGDGCSSLCLIEPGHRCSGQPSLCSPAICGDGVREGIEACDDGNPRPFDGCSAHCQVEPQCQAASCVSVCGDGLVIGEECDDGNRVDGDGCSAQCKREPGAVCLAQPVPELVNGQNVLRIPALFRDFSTTHADFGANACAARAPGALAANLQASGRPTLSAAPNAVAAACLSTAASFAEWYTDNANNAALVGELLLFDDGAGGYVNRFGADGQKFPAFDPAQQQRSFDGTPLFFPLDGSGSATELQPASIPTQFGVASPTPESTLFPGAANHDFAFTMEVQHRFRYSADTRASLTIGADDDVWIFLNGRLALDLGGTHDPLFGTLAIDAAQGTVTATVLDGASPSVVSVSSGFGLAPDSVAALSIFHAERKPPFSAFELQMTGFEPSVSQCFSVCGDGLLTLREQCDDGLNAGGYGACGPACVLGPFCGDGIIQTEFGESCDVGPGGDATCRGCRILPPR